MFESAAFGFVYLAWWTWPLMAGIVFGTMWVAMHLDRRRDRKEDAAAGPHPCLAHLGTETDQTEWWCWLKEGHAGVHRNQWGVDVTEETGEMTASRCTAESVIDGWSCFLDAGHDGPHHDQPNPMQSWRGWARLNPEQACTRSSNCYMIDGHDGPCHLDYSDDPRQDVVVRDTTVSGLCTHGEDGKGNPDGCWKPAGHDGPHMIMGSYPDE